MGQVQYENNIQNWLMSHLREMGLSVEQFANLVGLSRASIYFYFQDKCRPSEEAMAAICDVLGVPLEEGLQQYIPKKTGRPSGKHRLNSSIT